MRKQDRAENQGWSSVRKREKGRHSQQKEEKAEMWKWAGLVFWFGEEGIDAKHLEKSYWLDWKRGRDGNQHFPEASVVKIGLVQS